MKTDTKTATNGITPTAKSSPGRVAPFVVGTLVGVGVALLTAPQSGKETRKMLKGKVRQLETKAIRLKGKATQTIATAQKLINGPKKAVLATAKRSVKVAVKRSRRGAARKRS